MTTTNRVIRLGAAAALVVGSALATTPAVAGGETMVSGSTMAECKAVMAERINVARDSGATVIDTTPCTKMSAGYYLGSFETSRR